jgi:nicotinate-nucleotide adenylyltransferase
VLLMPTGVAPHKTIDADPGADVRVEMARAAASVADGVEVSDLEVRRDGPSYTYETLEALRESEPEDELVWLMGADAAVALESWKRPERVVELARLAVAPRADVMRADLDAVLERLAVDDAEAIEMPTVGVSSSEIRERVRTGRPIRHLVPDPVIDVIEERGLYGS